MKKNVLISGVGGSVFPDLFRFLENDYNLFLTDANKVLKKIYPKKKVLIIPFVINDSFEKVMENIIDKNKIEYYIPGIDEEIPKTFSFQELFKDLKLICPKKEFVELCLNKYELMKELEQRDISIVKTSPTEDFKFDIDFPLFLKPVTGRGSRGICKVDDLNEFNAYFVLEKYDKKDILIQEYLDGIEYTVSVVVNNLNKLIAIVPKRIFLKSGITINAVTEKNTEIEDICKKIVTKFKPCGPFNVQLKIVNEEIKIFEINPRFSTTSILTCQAGINEYKLCIEAYNQNDITFIDSFKENLFLYRRWENIFYED